MVWTEAELDALRGLYYQSHSYNRQAGFGIEHGGLTYAQMATEMDRIAARENWDPDRQRQYHSRVIEGQLQRQRFRPPEYLMAPYSGPQGPSGYIRPNFNFQSTRGGGREWCIGRLDHRK